ncbi:hypothetical protein DSCW_65310 [Desulfosarcina widdelii]|uniref:Uncharacterized protein n=1 Tax=Desulfosarcina widdelii TaxID=947919 RepID=A0A5K7ZLF6_9BACT|nr:hypothetical protein [Desulfosarcina widdelii]BBO79114.1 hypothetical protein DSCW_65310 [Desulfosarcina widdelii]
MHSKNEITTKKQPLLMRQDGRVWFTREAERRFYFILTMIMLAVGILYKSGII